MATFALDAPKYDDHRSNTELDADRSTKGNHLLTAARSARYHRRAI